MWRITRKKKKGIGGCARHGNHVTQRLSGKATVKLPSCFYWFLLLLQACSTSIILLPDFMHGVIGVESRPLICVICAACNLPLICFFNLLSNAHGLSLGLLDYCPDSTAPICSVLVADSHARTCETTTSQTSAYHSARC